MYFSKLKIVWVKQNCGIPGHGIDHFCSAPKIPEGKYFFENRVPLQNKYIIF